MLIGKTQHHVVVVGGGVAGLEIATSLGRRWKRPRHQKNNALSVTLVDADSAHIWKPMLHTIAAGTRDISQQQTAYIAQARTAGFAYQPGELSGVDRNAREVILGSIVDRDGRLLVPERRIAYDTLILAIGSRADDFDTPGVREHCLTIDTRRQADAFNREIRIRMLQCIAQGHDLSVAIVGGGATGVELAAELAQLMETSVAYGADGLKERITITLVESGPRLLAAFPEDISRQAKLRLEELGIHVLILARVRAVNERGIVLDDDSEIPASLTVWAAGVKAPDVLARLGGLEVNPRNQLVVRPSLQTTLDASIYAVGDCATLTYAGAARPLPPTAQVAHQQARHLIRHLDGAILHTSPVPDFAYRDLGSLVSLAHYDAYGSLGRFGLFTGGTIRGRIAQLSHAMLYRSHQSRLHGLWRGSLLWLVDHLNARLRASIRLD